jgi:hypothetical protein
VAKAPANVGTGDARGKILRENFHHAESAAFFLDLLVGSGSRRDGKYPVKGDGCHCHGFEESHVERAALLYKRRPE